MSSSDSSDMETDSDTSSDENEPTQTALDDDDDEIVKQFKRELTKKRVNPPDMNFDDDIVKISFHPENDLLAAASMLGDVNILSYTNDQTKLVDTWELHTDCLRDLKFSRDGTRLFTTSKDMSIMITDVETGKLTRYYDKAHACPVYSLCQLDANVIASGDDDGRVKFWDMRKSEPIYTIKRHEDFISDMIVNEAGSVLVCASGDGSISSIDLNKRQHFIQSEVYDEEITSLGIYRNGTKLLATTSLGNLLIFNWNEFGLHSDIFSVTTSKKSPAISDSVAITENVVVLAMEDGLLRAVQLFPHQHLGVAGQYTNKMTVECVDISNSGRLLATCAYNSPVKFWNVEYFETLQAGDSKEKKVVRKYMANNLPSSKMQNRGSFFSGLL